jgi:hypothetical protein
MKIWKTNNENLDFDYVFHLEDDWLFQQNFRLLDGINLLSDNDWSLSCFPSSNAIFYFIFSYLYIYFKK